MLEGASLESAVLICHITRLFCTERAEFCYFADGPWCSCALKNVKRLKCNSLLFSGILRVQGEALRASKFWVRSWNHGVVGVGMGFKNHLVPGPCPGQGHTPKLGYKPSVSTGKCGGCTRTASKPLWWKHFLSSSLGTGLSPVWGLRFVKFFEICW